MQKQRKSSIGSLLVTAVAILIIIVYAIISLNTRDGLWFLPTYSATASEIILHCYGEDVIPEPGSEAFNSLNKVVNESISGKKRWDSLSLSDVTYEEYQTSSKMMVLEFRYAEPEKIHSVYMFFKKFNQLLIPLDGRHADHNTIFGRMGKYPEAGSFHIEDKTPILQVVEEHNLCKKLNSQ